jgi:hypothetical protein
MMTPSGGSAASVSHMEATASAASRKGSGEVISRAPNGAVTPSIAACGAARRAIVTMSRVTPGSVLGLRTTRRGCLAGMSPAKV